MAETTANKIKYIKLRPSPKRDNDIIYWLKQMRKNGEELSGYCRLIISAHMSGIDLITATIPNDFEIRLKKDENEEDTDLFLRVSADFHQRITDKCTEASSLLGVRVTIVEYVKESIRRTIKISDDEQDFKSYSTYRNELSRAISENKGQTNGTLINTDKATKAIETVEKQTGKDIVQEQKHEAKNPGTHTHDVEKKQEKANSLLSTLIKQTLTD